MTLGAQLIAHMVGDYLFQSHWNAVEKTRRSLPAAIHALTYTLAFVLVPLSLREPVPHLCALLVIAVTHFVIDRWRLARYVVWVKNQAAPAAHRHAVTDTGYPESTPPWLATWLLIIADNTLHVVVNAWAILYLSRQSWSW